jgi:DNA-binding NtrC family response regulator
MPLSFLSKFLNRHEAQPEVLAVSPDDRFFTSVLCAALESNWKVRWVRSLENACEELANRSSRVVLYDCHPHSPEWQDAIGHFTSDKSRPSVVLAAPKVSEDLWRRALARGVYDVVPRSGRTDLLMATLGFAWKRRSEKLAPVASEDAAIVSVR